MASVNRWKHTADDFKAAYIEGQACIEKLKAQVKKLEAETNGCGVNARDIPIREIPIREPGPNAAPFTYQPTTRLP